MTAQVTLRVEGVCSDSTELQCAVDYLSAHPQIVEYSYNEADLTVYAASVVFPWDPTPPGTVVEE